MAVRGRVRRPNLNLLRALPALRRAAGPELGEVGSGSRRSGGRAGGVARSLTAATKDAVGVALATLRASRVTPAHTRPPCTCFVATIRMDEPFRAGGRGPAPVETRHLAVSFRLRSGWGLIGGGEGDGAGRGVWSWRGCGKGLRGWPAEELQGWPRRSARARVRAVMMAMAAFFCWGPFMMMAPQDKPVFITRARECPGTRTLRGSAAAAMPRKHSVEFRPSRRWAGSCVDEWP